jgi:hypothetical protein
MIDHAQQKSTPMARRTPQTFVKRQREMDKKKKAEEKRRRRQEPKEPGTTTEESYTIGGAGSLVE